MSYWVTQLQNLLSRNNIILVLNIYLLVSNIIKIITMNRSLSHIKTLKNYNQTLKNMNDDVRSFKHDFNNIIQAIGGYIYLKDIAGLKKYYKDILKDCEEMNTLDILNPDTINDPAIYNILINKIYLAKQNNIQINLYISIDLKKINAKSYETSKIIGILLDNAIEAARECNEKIINIEFTRSLKQPFDIIKIENTYAEKNINLNKIFDKSYSSKVGNTGLGLWKIRQILNKYKNLNLFTSKNTTFFIQQLEIY